METGPKGLSLEEAEDLRSFAELLEETFNSVAEGELSLSVEEVKAAISRMEELALKLLEDPQFEATRGDVASYHNNGGERPFFLFVSNTLDGIGSIFGFIKGFQPELTDVCSEAVEKVKALKAGYNC